jgi:small subunit ribosomal protein S13
METKTQSKQEFKAILRLADKEVKGEVPLSHAITKASGASFMFANAIIYVLKLEKKRQVGTLSADEIAKIEDVMRDPKKYSIPTWLLNRRKEVDSGEDRHIISSDLELTKRFDIRRLRRIKCYIGMRHARGDKKLKVRVRGQRTRGTGRRGKSVGVVKKK